MTGGRWGLFCDVTPTTACPHTPSVRESSPAAMVWCSLTVATRRRRSLAPLRDVKGHLPEISPSCRHRLAEAFAVSVPHRRRATICSRQLDSNQAARRAASLTIEPSCTLALSAFLSNRERASSKDTCVGVCGAISPPIALPPPQRPPLDLLPVRACPGSSEFLALTTKRWEGLRVASSDVASPDESRSEAATSERH